MTYKFIDHAIAASPTPPPFLIPRLRFVDAGLALAYTQALESISVSASLSRSSTRMTGAYLLEEKIECDGDFTKFVHNCDCIPLLDLDEEGYDIVEFLCFTQHVQYIKTKGLVYIADYQGSQTLLTDPQILTHPSVGKGRDLFGEGNLEIGVECFETEHMCNSFCQWRGFQLQPFRIDTTGSREKVPSATLETRGYKLVDFNDIGSHILSRALTLWNPAGLWLVVETQAYTEVGCSSNTTSVGSLMDRLASIQLHDSPSAQPNPSHPPAPRQPPGPLKPEPCTMTSRPAVQASQLSATLLPASVSASSTAPRTVTSRPAVQASQLSATPLPASVPASSTMTQQIVGWDQDTHSPIIYSHTRTLRGIAQTQYFYSIPPAQTHCRIHTLGAHAARYLAVHGYTHSAIDMIIDALNSSDSEHTFALTLSQQGMVLVEGEYLWYLIHM
ncbi:hypothetical protein BKA82DRAFT_20948 [Pisolithus tinctorius]|uniref:Alpha-type protein kinase domain-containing protein n=1 Tax=Pisolithus tinctorius Marx 270 TaxID=870435 RepID=A0A0C3PQA0_PISTI|nr:hypothetical protein BKA82DRAFT_20948 [Pisolithus tinctorius]KIO10694.1 hypothetical protein M404DRAFT_20948 [Pisolithus tinctorius Marx 270]